MEKEKITIRPLHESILIEEKVLTEADTKLLSKVDSLIRDIKNLEDKIKRLEFEIKLKKKALVRKREETKKISKTLTVKAKLLKESNLDEDLISSILYESRRGIQRVLTESSKALES